MSPTVKSLLDSFDALSERERHQATVEILRRIAPADVDLMEQVFIEAADEAFSALDAEEAEAVNGSRQEG
jgi:hypothetical protein